MSDVLTDTEVKFFLAVKKEAEKARTKFPSSRLLGLAFAEESGELIKAVLDFEQKGGTKEQIYKEAVQTCAMALRLLTEGDETLVFKGIGNDTI